MLFTVAALVGENVNRISKSDRAWALRHDYLWTAAVAVAASVSADVVAAAFVPLLSLLLSLLFVLLLLLSLHFTHQPPLPPTRWIAGTWMSVGLVMSAGFGGSLRAHLTRPGLGRSLDTLTEVVSSGLPWEMIRYGGAGDDSARQSEDDHVRTIYRERILLPYEMYSFQRVSGRNRVASLQPGAEKHNVTSASWQD